MTITATITPAACEKGNSSIHATGSSPGFITEALPIVLSSIQRRVDSIVIDEFANMVDGCSPFMLFETMGYGKSLTTFDEARLGMVHNGFRQSLELLGEALGKPFEEIKRDLKELVHDRYDHQTLNTVAPFDELSPTTENLALVFLEDLRTRDNRYTRVRVWETDNNYAEAEV